MTVHTLLEISTAHIPKHTAEAIETLETVICEKWSEYGWIIWIGEDNAIEEHKELNNILDYCREHNITYLKLDCDAETTAAFPTFNW